MPEGVPRKRQKRKNHSEACEGGRKGRRHKAQDHRREHGRAQRRRSRPRVRPLQEPEAGAAQAGLPRQPEPEGGRESHRRGVVQARRQVHGADGLRAVPVRGQLARGQAARARPHHRLTHKAHGREGRSGFEELPPRRRDLPPTREGVQPYAQRAEPGGPASCTESEGEGLHRTNRAAERPGQAAGRGRPGRPGEAHTERVHRAPQRAGGRGPAEVGRVPAGAGPEL